MKRKSFFFKSEDGLAVVSVLVDPPDDPDSVQIVIEDELELELPRTKTPDINPNLLASLQGKCRRIQTADLLEANELNDG